MSTDIRDQFRKTLIEEIAPMFRLGVPLEQQRQVLDGVGAQAELPEGVTIETRDLAGLHTEWITSRDASTEHTIFHVHGGGYVMGSCGSHHGLSASIASAAKMQVVLPEYRLAPEHPFPAALDDAHAAYCALLELGRDPAKLALLGDSAGGGLALSLLLRLRDEKLPLPGAAVLLSPWTDLTASGESIRTRAAADPWLSVPLLSPFGDLYRGAVAADDPRISPLFGDLSGLPPILIHVGDQEILLSDSTRLHERARQAGVDIQLEIWPELWHVFHLFAPGLPDAVDACNQVGEFLRAKLVPCV
jgi:acetyl esterase/lipase